MLLELKLPYIIKNKVTFKISNIYYNVIIKLKGAIKLTAIVTIILSFVISSLIFNYLSKYLISNGYLKVKSRQITKEKVIWTIICCSIYIVGYAFIDFLNLDIIGFNIGRGVLLGLFVTLLLLDSNKK